jgi:inactive STAND
MNNEIELENWRIFLRDKSSKAMLSPTHREVCLIRFPDPYTFINHEQFCESIEENYPIIKGKNYKKTALDDVKNSVKGYLPSISKGFNLNIGINNEKSRIAFDLLVSEFNQWKKRFGSNSQVIHQHDYLAELHHLLLNLNYVQEEAKFQDLVISTNQPIIFLSEIDDPDTQQWFINRLVYNSPILNTSYGKGVKITPSWRTDNDSFWNWVSQSEKYDQSKKPDIIQHFCDFSKKEPVLMAIYNADILRESDLTIIIEDFWVPFQEKVQKIDRFDSNKCLLFLVGKPGWLAKKEKCFSQSEAMKIRLDEWSVTKAKHIYGWLSIPKVREYCELYSKKDFLAILKYFDITPQMLKEDPDHDLGTPSCVIDLICELIKIPGISELESNWRIKA